MTIRLADLQRSFQRGETTVQALAGIDLEITPGEFVALVGPSGSGKSTLLNLLGGLDRPSSGELWLDGLPLHTAEEKERTNHRRRRVGFVFQSFNLLPRFTALENVAVSLMLSGVPKAEREARATALLERVGLGHRLQHYPGELSGGEQQRTAIARALIHNPALVLADEPTGNLDSVTGEEVMALLQELNREQGVTLIVVTHDPEVAAYADRIVRLRDGLVEVIETVEPQTNGHRPDGLALTSPTANHDPLPEQGKYQFRDMLQTALRNLRRRPVRNILTAMGVLIGIVTLVAMVSFGVGVQREVQRNFETIGLENIFVSPRFAEPDEFDPFAAPTPLNPITPEVIAEIAAIPDVIAVTPRVDLPFGIDVIMTDGRETLPIRIFSDFEGGPLFFTDEEALAAGEELGEGDTNGAVLVTGLADRYLQAGESYADLIGREVVLTAQLPRGETEDFTTVIKGIVNRPGSRSVLLGVQERAAIKAWWFGQPDIITSQGYDGLIVRAEDIGAVPGVIDQMAELEVETQSLEAILDLANQVLSILQVLLGSVGALALLVAALGVANTMMMAIYERTREIGVLKALGAAPAEIRRLFTIEASMIGLIGGFFGLIVGTLLGRLLDWIAHRYLISEGVTGIGDLSIVPPWLALGALAFAALIGLLAGLYPAARAARLDPVTALRHE
jgi:ABC-type lipoprotein export system ATPase subunit/ABC-type lipoprotein release transport system permease subunit